MILNEPGQEYKYIATLYTVGGIVSAPMRDDFQMYGVLKEISVENGDYARAVCNFGADNPQKFLLSELFPVTVESPVTVGKLYVLHYQCDNSNGITSKVLGVSPSKSALLHLLLEDVKETKEDIDIDFHSAVFDEKEDTLTFEYQNNEPAAQCYLLYTNAPAPVCCVTKEGGTI